MKVKSESEVAQSCPTLSDPMNCSLPGSSSMGSSRQEYWSALPFVVPNKFYKVPMKDSCTGVVGEGAGLRMVQGRYISGALYFYYYDISSTSYHQALGPRGWE